MKATQCSIDGCERPVRTRGMCQTCYVRLLSRGEIQLIPVLSVAERLAAGLERKPNGCLEWTGGTYPYGYGSMSVANKDTPTHRVAWTVAHGPIPPGIHVLHHCDNPPCCQTEPTEGFPEGHLFLGTDADNIADMLTKGRHQSQQQTHCKNGHEFTPENTYRSKHQRHCRTCVKAASARSRERKQATS